MHMSIRLQVLMDPREISQMRKMAKAAETTVAELARQWLRQGMRQRSERPVEDRLSKLKQLSKTNAPTGSIEQMISEIEMGYRHENLGDTK